MLLAGSSPTSATAMDDAAITLQTMYRVGNFAAQVGRDGFTVDGLRRH